MVLAKRFRFFRHGSAITKWKPGFARIPIVNEDRSQDWGEYIGEACRVP